MWVCLFSILVLGRPGDEGNSLFITFMSNMDLLYLVVYITKKVSSPVIYNDWTFCENTISKLEEENYT